MATSMAVDQDGSVEKRMNMSLDDIIKETSKTKKGSGPRAKGIAVGAKRGKVSRVKSTSGLAAVCCCFCSRSAKTQTLSCLREHPLSGQVASQTPSQVLAA